MPPRPWQLNRVIPVAVIATLLMACDSNTKTTEELQNDPCQSKEDGAWREAAERACFRTLPKQTLSGFWVVKFEVSAYYDDRHSALEESGKSVWLELSPEAAAQANKHPHREATVFAAKFEGRVPPNQNGLGQYAQRIYVDRFLSLEEIRR